MEVHGMELALIIVYVIVCIGLILSVLLQSGKSAGLSGTIAGGAETFFGKKKGIDEKLARLTEILAISFMILSIAMIYFIS